MTRIRWTFAVCAGLMMLSLALAAIADEKKEADKSPAKRAGGKARVTKKQDAGVKAKAVPAKTEAASETKPDATKAKDSADTKADPAKKTDDKAAAKSAAYKVRPRLFKIEFTADGVFESAALTDVFIRAEEWIEFEVLKAVEHGARVKQGDVLVQLNMEKIDRVIADLQRDLSLGQLALKEAEAQLAATRALGPLDEALADRAKRMSDEDLAYFLNTDRPMAERSINFMVKMSENMLAYEQEELRQLEKMYKADDLVEETEEIILRRARDNVERAKFMVERYKSDRDQMLKMTLPRTEELIKHGTQKQTIDHAKAKIVLPLARQRAELGLEKLKVDTGRSEERLKRLLSDRAQMTVKAPASGLVYYGRCTRGKWSSTETLADKFRRGGRLANEDVFMTIVDPQPTGVRLSIGEKQIRFVKPGLKALLLPAALPEVKLEGVVQRVAAVPAGGQFDTALTVVRDDAVEGLLPGMTCEARFQPYVKADALAIPLTAVGSDDLDSRKSLVALPGKDGKVERREVTLGKRNDKQVEVLKGLAAGDEILAEFPKDKE